MSYPFGVTTRNIDSLCPSGRLPGQETCAACKREMVERWSDLWFVGDDRLPGGPLDAPRGEKCCSTACLSQFVYETAPEDVKSLMRHMAVSVNEWLESVRLSSFNLDWALRHSYLTHLMPRLSLEVANDAMESFVEELVGRDALLGTGDFPQWYEDAITPAGNARLAQVIGGRHV